MVSTLSAVMILMGVLQAIGTDVEARRKSEMCGPSCTCDQIRKINSENPGVVQACVDKVFSTGVEHYVGCGQGGPGCCHMSGSVEVCELLKPVLPGQRPPSAQAPLQGTPVQPPVKR
jgi:hypothetical protein